MSEISTVIFLEKLLKHHLTDKEFEWLASNFNKIDEDATGKKFLLAYSLVYRFISRNDISYSENELAVLEDIYPSFHAKGWNTHSLTRALLMLHLDPKTNKKTLQFLENTASDKEQEDLYKSLYFLENSEDFISFIEEGIRSNVITIYDAIAHYNPFPATYLSENSWNQLVLKGIFNYRPLYPIYKLQKRNNEKLALVANDYVRERWAAGRNFTPELWQLMLGNINQDLEKTVSKACTSENAIEKKAATKVLELKNTQTNTDTGFWESVGKEYYNI